MKRSLSKATLLASKALSRSRGALRGFSSKPRSFSTTTRFSSTSPHPLGIAVFPSRSKLAFFQRRPFSQNKTVPTDDDDDDFESDPEEKHLLSWQRNLSIVQSLYKSEKFLAATVEPFPSDLPRDFVLSPYGEARCDHLRAQVLVVRVLSHQKLGSIPSMMETAASLVQLCETTSENVAQILLPFSSKRGSKFSQWISSTFSSSPKEFEIQQRLEALELVSQKVKQLQMQTLYLMATVATQYGGSPQDDNSVQKKKTLGAVVEVFNRFVYEKFPEPPNDALEEALASGNTLEMASYLYHVVSVYAAKAYCNSLQASEGSIGDFTRAIDLLEKVGSFYQMALPGIDSNLFLGCLYKGRAFDHHAVGLTDLAQEDSARSLFHLDALEREQERILDSIKARGRNTPDEEKEEIQKALEIKGQVRELKKQLTCLLQ